jgi:hypothetical protein
MTLIKSETCREVGPDRSKNYETGSMATDCISCCTATSVVINQ